MLWRWSCWWCPVRAEPSLRLRWSETLLDFEVLAHLCPIRAHTVMALVMLVLSSVPRTIPQPTIVQNPIRL